MQKVGTYLNVLVPNCTWTNKGSDYTTYGSPMPMRRNLVQCSVVSDTTINLVYSLNDTFNGSGNTGNFAGAIGTTVANPSSTELEASSNTGYPVISAVISTIPGKEYTVSTDYNNTTFVGGYTESVFCEVIEGGITVASQSMTMTGTSYSFNYTAGAGSASVRYTYVLTPNPGPPPPPATPPFLFAIDNVKVYYLDTSIVDDTVCVSKSGYRYGFNGMEKVDEISGEGNGYDFGARIYDGRLGRWFSIDEFTDVYESFSPYISFLNNPVWFIDINGDDIWIGYFGTKMVSIDDPGNTGLTEKSEEYLVIKVKYKYGKFYNESGNEIQLKDIKNRKARRYVRQVAKDYNKINKVGKEDATVNCELTELNDKGNTLIRNWDSKKKNYTNDAKTPGFNSTVFYNPNSNNDGNGNERPAFIGLAHELHHAYTFLTKTRKTGTEPGSGLEFEEIDAVFFENRIRINYDIPLRQKYSGKDLPYIEDPPRNGGNSPKRNEDEK